jgi:hypothetical protein
LLLYLASPISLGGIDYLLPSNKVYQDSRVKLFTCKGSLLIFITKNEHNFPKATLPEAKKLCDSRQMDLLKVETPAENDLLSSFLSSQSKIENCILSLKTSNKKLYHSPVSFGFRQHFDGPAAIRQQWIFLERKQWRAGP